MIDFKIQYSLNYYDDRSVRFVFHDKNQKVKLVDSYSRTCVVWDYASMKQAGLSDINLNNLKLTVLKIVFLNGTTMWFFVDKISYRVIKKFVLDENVRANSTVEFTTGTFTSGILSANASDNKSESFIFQISKSQFDKHFQKLLCICSKSETEQ